MIIGDSHVRRLQQHGHWLNFHLQQVRVDWIYRGGAGIDFGERCVQDVRGYTLVILMLGGNDIANGMSPHQLMDRIGSLTSIMLQQGPDCIIVPSLWPRQDGIYNNLIRQYADLLESRHFMDPGVTFWRWDNRQPWRTIDGVHLLDHGYERATRTLIAMIVWTINHNQW